jgi:hypothetical protein
VVTNGLRQRRAAMSALQAPGVDQIDAFRLYDLSDEMRIPQDPRWVLGRRLERDILAARLLDRGGEAAAFREHERASARLRDRRRDLDSRQLRPSGVERGNDLQYGRARACQDWPPLEGQGFIG